MGATLREPPIFFFFNGGNGMKNIKHDDLVKFAGLVAKAWNDPQVLNAYGKDPKAVLTQHGITLPEGVPTPAIPPTPPFDAAGVGAAWKNLSFDNWDVTVHHLPGGSGAPAAKLSVGCLACVACPYSSFSSLSN
jgi:hypothetical protein